MTSEDITLGSASAVCQQYPSINMGTPVTNWPLFGPCQSIYPEAHHSQQKPESTSQSGTDFWFTETEGKWKQVWQACIFYKYSPLSVKSWTSSACLFYHRRKKCATAESFVKKWAQMYLNSRKWYITKMYFWKVLHFYISWARNSSFLWSDYVMSLSTHQNYTCEGLFTCISTRPFSWTISHKIIMSQYA